MKTVLFTLAATVALAVVPSAFGAHLWYYDAGRPDSAASPKSPTAGNGALRGWHKVRDGNAWVHSSTAAPEGITVITDTLGGNGKPATTPQTRPYLYGGAPPAVVDAYRHHESQTGFYRARYAAHRPVSTVAAPDAVDRYIARGAPTASSSALTSRSTGFDWGDAGIGAGTALGGAALLLLMGATLGGRKRRQLAL
jgi:hypothetical protein